MKIPLLDNDKAYLDFLYEQIRKSYCNEQYDCVGCPFSVAPNCSKLTHEQMDSILISEFRKEKEGKSNE